MLVSGGDASIAREERGRAYLRLRSVEEMLESENVQAEEKKITKFAGSLQQSKRFYQK